LQRFDGVSHPDDLELETVPDDEAPTDGRAQRVIVELGPRWRERSRPSRRFIACVGVAALLVIAGAVLVQSTGGFSGLAAPMTPAPTSSAVPAPSTVSTSRPSGLAPTTTMDPEELVAVLAPTTTLAPTTALGPATVDDVLPPVGLVPSSPEAGELVVAVSKIHDGAWYLYADGRLISLDDFRSPTTPGWIEQRLTPAGVERVRSEFLATGLFDLSQQPAELPPATEDAFASLRVRDGGKLLVATEATEGPLNNLSPCVGTIAPIDTPCDLIGYLRDLTSSLPEDEWVAPAFTRYVPAGYTACLTHDGTPGSPLDGATLPDLRAVLEHMPTPIQELLGSREPTRDLFEAADSCFDLTIAEARVLTASLLDAFGISLYASGGATFGFETGTLVQLVAAPVNVGIQVWPLLPAGGLAIWGY
jgi:hypothetical protein